MRSPTLRRRKTEIFLLVATAALLLGGGAAAFSLSALRENGRITDIGIQFNPFTAEQIALHQLYRDAVCNPNTPECSVTWSDTLLALVHQEDKDYERTTLRYEPQARRLTNESGGAGGGWDGVTVPMLERASKEPNPFAALESYGCTDWP